jgi:serine protease Do
MPGGDRPLELDVAVDHLNDMKVASADGESTDQSSGAPKLGMALAALNPELRSRLQIGPEAGCAVITHVTPGSVADTAGLEGGDVIERINGQHVDSPESANALFARAEKAPGKPILLLIDRHGSESFKALPQTTGEG